MNLNAQRWTILTAGLTAGFIIGIGLAEYKQETHSKIHYEYLKGAQSMIQAHPTCKEGEALILDDKEFINGEPAYKCLTITSILNDKPIWNESPPPKHRKMNKAYWQLWCNRTYGSIIDFNDRQQTALDWSDHCTQTGDANGR
jgi:hypothetical protein